MQTSGFLALIGAVLHRHQPDFRHPEIPRKDDSAVSGTNGHGVWELRVNHGTPHPTHTGDDTIYTESTPLQPSGEVQSSGGGIGAGH